MQNVAKSGDGCLTSGDHKEPEAKLSKSASVPDGGELMYESVRPRWGR